MIRHDLHTLPEGAVAHGVTATPAQFGGRGCLRVSLTDEITRQGRPGVDYVDQPTFLVLPGRLADGVLQVDFASRLRADAPEFARAFAGLAYRIVPDCRRFEAVYVRPLNSARAGAPDERQGRVVQWFSFPEWPFSRLREQFPDGPHEAGADVAPGEWLTLRVEVHGRHVTTSIDGTVVLDLDGEGEPGASGAVGLFVDIGTDAFFSNLWMQPS